MTDKVRQPGPVSGSAGGPAQWLIRICTASFAIVASGIRKVIRSRPSPRQGDDTQERPPQDRERTVTTVTVPGGEV
jgi:hypothetical protein